MNNIETQLRPIGEVKLPDTRQFSIRRLFLWTLFSAMTVSIVSAFPGTLLAHCVTAFVALIFIALDLKFKENFRGWLAISYFACALAYAVLAGYLTMAIHPPRVPATGNLRSDFLDSLELFFEATLRYLGATIVCTGVSTSIALLCLKQNRSSSWLLVMNVPGIFVFIICVIAIVSEL